MKNILTVAAMMGMSLVLACKTPAKAEWDGKSTLEDPALAGTTEGESDEFFTPCDPPILRTQTFEPLKRDTDILPVRIKGTFETPGPGYITSWEKDDVPSATTQAAIVLRIVRPLNLAPYHGQEYKTGIDWSLAVGPETKDIRIRVVSDFLDIKEINCKIKPQAVRARNEMDLD